jgi:anti-sigma regulatory factor (Ser/Thr protein kinase)
VKADRTFPADPASITAARRFVMTAAGELAAELRDAISVMVSELAMNAFQHAHTSFDVRIECTGRKLRVEVTDSGGGQPQSPLAAPAGRLRGRGLMLVQRLSDQWGVTPTRSGAGKTVWFQVAVPAGTTPASKQG